MTDFATVPGLHDASVFITAMTRSLAREFRPDRIRMNALAPGWMLTGQTMMIDGGMGKTG